MRNFFLLTSIILSLSIVHSCTYTMKIKDGATAYERKQYAVAAPMLEKEYWRAKEGTKERAKLAFLAGESYNRMDNTEKALEWYQKAHKDRYGEKASMRYAFALKRAEMYMEAADVFRELEAESTSLFNYRKEVQACNQAILWKRAQSSNLYKVSETPFNSPKSDYSPVIYKDGTLLLSSDRDGSMGDESFKWTGNQFSDLYVFNPKEGEINPIPGSINTVYNEGTATFNADFSQMIFTRCGTGSKEDDYCKLLIANYNGTEWSDGEVLPFIQDNVNYSHPFWSADGKVLYFVADYEDGWGGFDIYKINKSQSGWGEPQILSASINTEMDDMFPTLDGDTLYFSSNGRGGMGGLDIYKTYPGDDGKWIFPVNLQAPMNSGEDDFGLIITEKTEGNQIHKGYFTSLRRDGKGMDDIYAFTKDKPLPPPPPPVIEVDTPVVVVPPPPPVEKDVYLEIYVYGKSYTNPSDPNNSLTGWLPLPKANLQINSSVLNNQIKVDDYGKYKMKIEKNVNYRFFAMLPDFYNTSASFTTQNKVEKDVYRLDIRLEQIIRNVEFNLDNIYYDYTKWDIREDAKPSLNELANILMRNPQINISLGSHTDCRGTNASNEALAQKRANSAVEYLVSLGVERRRLQAIGYGENSPAVPCACDSCSEDEHQANRRTTFKILGN